MSATMPAIVGRDAVLTALTSMFAPDAPGVGVVLEGDPGIGKSTLWAAAVALALSSGFRVLTARASEGEVALSYVALADLLAEVDLARLTDVPTPQRRAVEIALLRADPGDDAAEPRAVAAGFRGVLATLSEQQPVVVAIDDVAWLDRPSADVLSFAARRLLDRPVRFLLSRRPGSASELERVLHLGGMQKVAVNGLSLGAIRLLLAERLGLVLPRRVLRQVLDATGGNPLYALELGRTLLEQGVPEIGAELPAPESLDGLFGERVGQLPRTVRRVLLAVALNERLTRGELEQLAGPLAVEDARAAGLLAVEDGRLRASHPLLAAAVRKASTVRERRALHLELARTVGDGALRARHRSLAVDRPDAALAASVAAAASEALNRGAADEAVELAGQALRLTPPETPARAERLLALARCLIVAGEATRARELIESRISDLPTGAPRARAYLLLSESADGQAMDGYLDRALAEGADDPAVSASALASKSLLLAIGWMRDLERAEALARQALAVADSVGIEAQRRALHSLAWIRVLRGRPVDDLLAGFVDAPQGFSLYESALERPAGIRSMLRGEIDAARAVFGRLLALAEERGEARSGSVMHVQLCDIALRAGDVRAAAELLTEWDEWSIFEDDGGARMARCRALLDALRGEFGEADRWAQIAIVESAKIENRREELEGMRAAGLAALGARDPRRAEEMMWPVWEHCKREGIDDPGALPIAPDLVEALIELERIDDAAAVTERLHRLAVNQDHPWGLASARRCRALLNLARGVDVEQAQRELADAATAYRELGLGFDAARSLLALGRAHRRLRHWGAARRALNDAASLFDDLGCTGWADAARAELTRIGGRKAVASAELTPTEQRVAELAAAGLSNKQIARTLVVSVNTVERHLSHAYAKLGVRSRTQLAARLAAPPMPQ